MACGSCGGGSKPVIKTAIEPIKVGIEKLKISEVTLIKDAGKDNKSNTTASK